MHPITDAPELGWAWDGTLTDASSVASPLRDALEEVLVSIQARRINLHSFAVVHRGTVLLERYWEPYSRDSIHRMYSVSKSLTALAVGICLGDGAFHLDDELAGLLDVPEAASLHPWLRATTVRDALMMRTPHDATAYKKAESTDLVHAFFTARPDRPPGLSFSYDTSASVVLAALVEHSSGRSVSQLLTERLWPQLGCEHPLRSLRTPKGLEPDPRFPAWREVAHNPAGVDHGGSGLFCSTRDLTRVGLMLASGGRVAGTQVIDPDFVSAATSRQTTLDLSMMIDADIVSGYGYQTWITPGDGFAFLGMGGQLLLVHPRHQLVVAMTADDQGREVAHATVLNAVRRHVLPALTPAGPQTVVQALPQSARVAAPPVDAPWHPVTGRAKLRGSYEFEANGLKLRLAELSHPAEGAPEPGVKPTATCARRLIQAGP